MSDNLSIRADSFRLGTQPTDKEVDQANRLIDDLTRRNAEMENKLAKAPTPPQGWNVMLIGQIGWHVEMRQSEWHFSPLFGADGLMEDGR